MTGVLRSVALFVVAGLCEIGGGFFIVLSLLWGWFFDGNRPDAADTVGAAIALVGVCVMMYWPRGGP
jgi:drug/metabolite transporter superfamily protein YnfA